MRYSILILALFAIISCNTMSKEDKATLQEASEIHEEAVEIASSLKEQREAVMAKLQLLQGQDSLSAADSMFIQKAIAIQRAQTWYDDNHIEVPGHGHDSHEGHGHDHDHDHHDHDHDHDHGPSPGVNSG